MKTMPFTKIKLPKKICICGKPWAIKYNREESGGHFSGDKMEITVGTLCRNDIIETLLHEICEALLVELRYRYSWNTEDGDNGSMIFNMSHAEYTNFILNLADIFNQLMGVKK